MAEDSLLPNPIGKMRKAVSEALDKLVEPKHERPQPEINLQRRGLLAGTVASAVICPGEAAKQAAQVLLPNAATVEKTIAAGGALGKVVEKVATNWEEISGTLDKAGELITSMAGKYGYNPILEDFPKHITDNYGPQNTLRGLSQIDLSKIPNELSIEDFAPGNVDKIAEALGGEISKDSFKGKLKNISRVLDDLQKHGKSVGRDIQTVGDAQKLLGERISVAAKDVIANCDPELLREGTISDLEESLKMHGVDTKQMPEIQRAREGIWERNKKWLAEFDKKEAAKARAKIERANESPRERLREDRVVKCEIVSDFSDQLGTSVFTITPETYPTPTGFRGLTHIHFLNLLQTAAQNIPELREVLTSVDAKTIFPKQTSVELTGSGGLRITTTNTILKDFLAKSAAIQQPDGTHARYASKKMIEIPFLTQIVAPIKD